MLSCPLLPSRPKCLQRGLSLALRTQVHQQKVVHQAVNAMVGHEAERGSNMAQSARRTALSAARGSVVACFVENQRNGHSRWGLSGGKGYGQYRYLRVPLGPVEASTMGPTDTPSDPFTDPVDCSDSSAGGLVQSRWKGMFLVFSRGRGKH